MKLSSLGPVPIAVIGIVLCLLAVGGITWFMIMPASDRITKAQSRLDAAAPGSTPEERAAGLAAAHADAQKQLLAAQAQVLQVKHDWAVDESQYMPPLDVSDRKRAWQQLTTELTFKLGPDLEHWLSSTGVVPLVTVSLPAPPINPNDPKLSGAPLAIPIGTSTASTGASSSSGGYGGSSPGGYGGSSLGGPGGSGGGGGTIAVGGDLKSILNHVLKWNDFNRLVLIDGLSLHGNSPYMQGTYTGTVYEFPQNDTNPAAPLTTTGGGAASTTGPGGPGGYPGGMAGMRPPGR